MATALQEFITTLKEKVDIVEVAGGYLTLERRGNGHWACCPFHHEKTPSFCINSSDQYFHCFGCGESGDVIKLVREMENVEFMDAVKLLAQRAGLEVPQTTGFDNKNTVELKRKRDVLLNIMNDCAHFYLDNLNSGKADEHINYILKRNIPSNIVRAFGLGASLNFYDLPKFLLFKGYSKQDVIDSGAVNEVDGRLTDAQGGRLIIPIINAMDEVIAFGGRVLKKTEFAKYKNTKETLLFNKSKSLYNINLLKKLRKTQTINEVIMVEGYMDTISLYQAGFKNVVASMGTSLTQEQARLIKRYTDTVLISYDGDGAGQKANMRGLDILKNAGLNVKVVPLPEGLDPDDVIKQRGAQGYRNCLDNAMPLIDYKLKIAKGNLNISDNEERKKYILQAIKIIKGADSASEQDDLLKRLRDQTGISYESLKRDLNSAPDVPKPVTEQPKEKKDNSSTPKKASRFIIAAFLFGAKFSAEEDVSKIPFKDDVHKVIAKYICTKTLLEERISPSEVLELFENDTKEFDELNKIFDYSNGDNFTGEVGEKYFYDCIKVLRLCEIDEKIDVLKRKANAENDLKLKGVIVSEIVKLTVQRKKIKSGEK